MIKKRVILQVMKIQSFNHSINQSIRQWIKKPINQSINQWQNQPVEQSINQPIDQSTSESINQSINQSIERFFADENRGESPRVSGYQNETTHNSAPATP